MAESSRRQLDDPNVNYGFTIRIDQFEVGRFQEANGIEWTVAKESFQEGGNNHHQVNLIGQGTFKPLVLKRGMLATDTEFFTWLTEQMDPSAAYTRRQITIDVLDAGGDTLYTYNFEGAFLTRYKGPALNATQSGIAFEELEICYDRFQFEAA